MKIPRPALVSVIALAVLASGGIAAVAANAATVPFKRAGSGADSSGTGQSDRQHGRHRRGPSHDPSASHGGAQSPGTVSPTPPGAPGASAPGASAPGASAPSASAPGSAAGGTTVSVMLTGYGWWDNTPPGSAEISNPVIHRQAGGTGTYADPITVAVPYHCDNGCLHWPAGTRFYLPSLQRYLIVEDTCGDGGPDTCPDSTGNHLDVWVGGQSLTHAQSDACEESITGNTTAVLGPDANRTVTPGDIC